MNVKPIKEMPGFVALMARTKPGGEYSCLPWTIHAPRNALGQTAPTSHRAGETEPDIVVPVCRGVVVAVGGTDVDCIVVPGAAAKNTVSIWANRLWGPNEPQRRYEAA